MATEQSAVLTKDEALERAGIGFEKNLDTSDSLSLKSCPTKTHRKSRKLRKDRPNSASTQLLSSRSDSSNIRTKHAELSTVAEPTENPAKPLAGHIKKRKSKPRGKRGPRKSANIGSNETPSDERRDTDVAGSKANVASSLAPEPFSTQCECSTLQSVTKNSDTDEKSEIHSTKGHQTSADISLQQTRSVAVTLSKSCSGIREKKTSQTSCRSSTVKLTRSDHSSDWIKTARSGEMPLSDFQKSKNSSLIKEEISHTSKRRMSGKSISKCTQTDVVKIGSIKASLEPVAAVNSSGLHHNLKSQVSGEAREQNGSSKSKQVYNSEEAVVDTLIAPCVVSKGSETECTKTITTVDQQETKLSQQDDRGGLSACVVCPPPDAKDIASLPPSPLSTPAAQLRTISVPQEQEDLDRGTESSKPLREPSEPLRTSSSTKPSSSKRRKSPSRTKTKSTKSRGVQVSFTLARSARQRLRRVTYSPSERSAVSHRSRERSSTRNEGVVKTGIALKQSLSLMERRLADNEHPPPRASYFSRHDQSPGFEKETKRPPLLEMVHKKSKNRSASLVVKKRVYGGRKLKKSSNLPAAISRFLLQLSTDKEAIRIINNMAMSTKK